MPDLTLPPSSDEMAKARETAMNLAFKDLSQKAEERAIETVRAEVDRILGEKPDRSQLGLVALSGQPKQRLAYGEGVRLISPHAVRYLRLPEIQRKIRTPDSDHWMAQWLRGKAWRDRGILMEADAKLEELGFPRVSVSDHERADLLEGLASGVTGMTAGSGASLMPTPLAAVTMLARDKRARLRPIVSSFTSAGKTLRVPTAGSATVAMVAEGATATQGEPSIAHKLLDKKKAQGVFEASIELLADSAFDLVSLFSERAGSALGALEDVQICTSNGTAPNITSAIITGVTEVTEAVSATLAYADVVSLYFAVPEPYRAGGSWLGDGTVMKLLSLIDDGNGRPIFQPSIDAPAVVGNTAGNVGSIFGRPVYDVPLAAGTLMFGDFREGYGLLDAGGISVAISEHIRFLEDGIVFKFTTRFDGNILTVAALRIMLGLTTAG